jgi:hypothetical protein
MSNVGCRVCRMRKYRKTRLLVLRCLVPTNFFRNKLPAEIFFDFFENVTYAFKYVLTLHVHHCVECRKEAFFMLILYLCIMHRISGHTKFSTNLELQLSSYITQYDTE